MNEQEQQEILTKTPTCKCGRSPVGHCMGWHKLSEDEFRQTLAEWESNVLPKNDLV
jgi:hypothetical protein